MMTGRWARARRLALNLGLLFGTVALVLLVLEGAVRLFAPQQLVILRPDVWMPVERLGWQHVPDQDTMINTGERWARLLTDAKGHRVGSREPEARDARILAVGDSFLEAIQMEHHESIAGQLESLLLADTGLEVDVVNAGVGGWSPIQYRIKVEDELATVPYDGVLVFLFLGNDAISSTAEAEEPRRIAERHAFAWPRGWSFRAWKDGVLYPVNDALETRSHLFVLARNRAKFLLMRLGLSAHHFPDSLLTSERDSPRWGRTAELCAEMAASADWADVPVLFVFLPGLYQVDEEMSRRYVDALGIDSTTVDLDQASRLLGAQLDARGLDWLDVTPVLRRAHASGVPDLFGRVDTHLAPGGHRLVAEAVAPIVSAWL